MARSNPQILWCCSKPQTSAHDFVFKLQARNISVQQLDEKKGDRERVVILGSGWAGYSLAHDLDRRKYQPVVVSPRSYFVFTPLLASTSVGTLEFRTVLEPVRQTVRLNGFFQGWADDVDFTNKILTVEEALDDPTQGQALTGDRREGESQSQVKLGKETEAKKGELFDIKYDKLAIAVGCYAQTFNTKGVKENAFFLKDVGDARKIRNRLLYCFEAASFPTTSEKMRSHLLNFAIVGGGPTGIEFSAELHDLIKDDMRKLYPELAGLAQITVYDVAPQVLNMFDDRLAQYAMDHFKREGIGIKTSRHIEELRPGAPHSIQNQEDVKDDRSCYTINLKEEGEIGIGMCVWSTGLMMNPFVQNALAGKLKSFPKSGAIATNDRLQVLREDGSIVPDVYGIGDCAAMESAEYPATAQVASQKATWLAKRLNKGDIEHQKFTWKNLGVMAYIGNSSAILQSEGGNISGRVAWFIW